MRICTPCGRSIGRAVSVNSSIVRASTTTTWSSRSPHSRSGALACRRSGIRHTRMRTALASTAGVSPRFPAWGFPASFRTCVRRAMCTEIRLGRRSRFSARVRGAWRAWPLAGTVRAIQAKKGAFAGSAGRSTGSTKGWRSRCRTRGGRRCLRRSRRVAMEDRTAT